MGVNGLRLWFACLVLAIGVGPGCADYLSAEKSEQDLRPLGEDVGVIESNLVAPVRVLFVIDASQSMLVVDPDGRRLDALREVFALYVNDEHVEFGVIGFSGSSVLLTQRDYNGDGLPEVFFTRVPQVFDQALIYLAEAGGNTSYHAALFRAGDSIRKDLTTLDPDCWADTHYRIVFLSDGLPYPVDFEDDFDTEADVLTMVERIGFLEVEFGLAELSFDTVYLWDGHAPDEIRLAASDLLSEMAGLGGGSYTEFEEADQLSFLHLGLGGL